MSNVKIEDLSPVPFFAHFLEGQFKDLTAEEMKAVRGGAVVTLAYPSDQEGAERAPVVTMAFPSDQEGAPVGEFPDIKELLRRASERLGQVPGNPGNPVTLAYPSDQENVPF